MNYKNIAKLTIFSILMIIILIIGLTIFSITFNDWIIYDNRYLIGNPEFILPVEVQVFKAIILLSLVLFILIWCTSLWEINKINNKKIKRNYFLTGGVFLWILLPYTVITGIKQHSYRDFWDYLNTKKEAVEQINFSKWISGFKKKKNKLFWNTSLFMFLILVVIVDFSLIWITKKYVINDPSGNIMFNTFSFFTEWTNFGIIIFVLLFSFSHQTISLRNNTILILMSAYISVVAVLFWGYLLPFGSFKNSYSHLPSFVKTVWLHGITPITFIFFAVNSLYISKEKPNTFLKVSIIGSPFPLTYAAYSYSISFVTRHSIYGIITNLNPNMVDFSSNMIGNPLYSLFFFVIAGIFYLFFFIFWKIADVFYKRGLKIKEEIKLWV